VRESARPDAERRNPVRDRLALSSTRDVLREPSLFRVLVICGADVGMFEWLTVSCGVADLLSDVLTTVLFWYVLCGFRTGLR
jgi:hypothetical protein